MKPLKPITLEQAHKELVTMLMERGAPLPIPKWIQEAGEVTDEDIAVIADGFIDSFLNNRVHHWRYLLKNLIAHHLQANMGFIAEDTLKNKPVTVFKATDESADSPPTDGNWLNDIDLVKR